MRLDFSACRLGHPFGLGWQMVSRLASNGATRRTCAGCGRTQDYLNPYGYGAWIDVGEQP